MNLAEVWDFKQGQEFQYKGEPQTVIWIEKDARDFAMFFLPAKITLGSNHPDPELVEMEDYL